MKRNDLGGSLAAKLFWRFFNRLINLLPPREVPSAPVQPAKATRARGQRWQRSPAQPSSRCLRARRSKNVVSSVHRFDP